ncbi:MAG TPA: YbaB/EbfC family nucleoid-associated protein [Bacteroidia bacterium]|nr:YbaB/EbfC family nucleoid-associated protein [Bacteroidia bacterium]
MFGKLGDMMSRIGEMKQKAEEVKQALEHNRIHAEGAGGDVKVEMNGNRKLISLDIAPALQHGDAEALRKHLMLTFNKAVAEADKVFEEEMKKAASGILPGL